MLNLIQVHTRLLLVMEIIWLSHILVMVILNEVLYVPAIRKNLISIRRFCRDNDCFFEMNANGFRVKDNKTGKVILTSNSSGGLYHLNAAPNVTNKIVFYGEKTTQDVWHARLGHPSHLIFQTLLNKYHLPLNGTVANNKVCYVCPMGKSCKLPFQYRTSHALHPFDLLHLGL